MEAAIAKIREAEASSGAIIGKASETAKEIVKKAAAECAARRKAILDEAQAKRADMLRQAKQDALALCAPLAKQAEHDLDRIRHPEGDKFDRLIEVLTKRLTS